MIEDMRYLKRISHNIDGDISGINYLVMKYGEQESRVPLDAVICVGTGKGKKFRDQYIKDCLETGLYVASTHEEWHKHTVKDLYTEGYMNDILRRIEDSKRQWHY